SPSERCATAWNGWGSSSLASCFILIAPQSFPSQVYSFLFALAQPWHKALHPITGEWERGNVLQATARQGRALDGARAAQGPRGDRNISDASSGRQVGAGARARDRDRRVCHHRARQG